MERGLRALLKGLQQVEVGLLCLQLEHNQLLVVMRGVLVLLLQETVVDRRGLLHGMEDGVVVCCCSDSG